MEFATLDQLVGNGTPDFVFFDDEDDITVSPTPKTLYTQDYDGRTQEYYRVLRSTKLDPISQMKVDEKEAFTYSKIWDPYSGTVLGDDPYGAIYFDPVTLAKYFYTNITRKLWNQPVDEEEGFYQGYYDGGVGAGEDFYIEGRGHFPEWYVFRLPLSDCYLPEDYNKSIPTLGPKLTDKEVKLINYLLHKKDCRKRYREYFGRSPPDLVQMKELYDTAINQNPYEDVDYDLEIWEDMSVEQINDAINRDAVDKLVKIKG